MPYNGLLFAKTARAKSAKIARALAGNPADKFPEVAFCLVTSLLLAKTARAIDQLIALARARRGNSGHKFPEVAFCLITRLLLAKTARAIGQLIIALVRRARASRKFWS